MNGKQTEIELDRSAIISLVLCSLEDTLNMGNDGRPRPAELGADTRLIGREGVLDSMGLVTLLVDVEQRLEEEHDVVLILADERAMSQQRSPFRSVGSLTDYVCQLLEEQG
jgi:acyl carrier protein